MLFPSYFLQLLSEVQIGTCQTIQQQQTMDCNRGPSSPTVLNGTIFLSPNEYRCHSAALSKVPDCRYRALDIPALTTRNIFHQLDSSKLTLLHDFFSCYESKARNCFPFLGVLMHVKAQGRLLDMLNTESWNNMNCSGFDLF